MCDEGPFREEVRRQLYGAAEAGTDHGGTHTSVHASYTISLVDLAGAVDRVAVPVLGADGQEGRVALKTGLYEEEGGARDGTEESRRGTAKHVDAEVLSGAVAQ